MPSGRLIDYLGSGVIADRPATPDLHPGTLGLWYATDTDTLSAWDGAAWADISSGGSAAWGMITGTLSSQTDLQSALNAKLDDSQATAFGLSVLGAADATAGRTALGLGTAATQASTAFATAAQGTKADSALQSVVAGTNVTIDNTDPINPIINASGGGGGGSPGGSTTQVQYNNAGSFAGAADFTYASGVLAIPRIDTAKGTDIARSATTNIWAATGNFVHLTGTTTVTSFGANTAGMERVIRFAGAGTLTHNATSLILPGGANITTAANDTALVVGEGGSNARVVVYQRANGQALVASAGASLTNFTGSLNTASPNNTVNAARLLVTGGTTNVDFVLQPKGTGALLANLPDSAVAGGNKRGTGAVDWQLIRENAADVANGNYSTLSGGYSNQAFGQYGAVAGGIYNRITAGECGGIGGGYGNGVSSDYAFIGGGQSNTASGLSSVILGGNYNVASGARSSIIGGQLCSVTGDYSRAGGNSATDRGVTGADAYASASVGGSGDMQRVNYHLGLVTTDATASVATTTASAAASTNQITLQPNSSYRLRGSAIARQNTTGDSKSWDLSVTIKQGAAAANTAIVGSAVVTAVDADAGAASWTIALTADTTTGCLRVQVTGQAAKTIKWSIRLDSIEAMG